MNHVIILLAVLVLLVGAKSALAATGHADDTSRIEHVNHGDMHVRIESRSLMLFPSDAHVDHSRDHHFQFAKSVGMTFADMEKHAGHHGIRCDPTTSSECNSMCQACSGALSIAPLSAQLFQQVGIHSQSLRLKDVTRPTDGQFRPPRPTQV